MLSRSLQALEFPKVLEIVRTYCVSDMAAQRVMALAPLSTLQSIEYEQSLYSQAFVWRDTSAFVLHFFHDVSPVLATLATGHTVLDLDALWVLREGLFEACALEESLLGGKGVADGGQAWPLLLAHVQASPLPALSISALRRCMRDDGELRDESSPELLAIRTNLRQLHQTCLRHVKDIVVQYNMTQYVQDTYMTLASDRYVLPLKTNFKGRLQGIIHDYSNTGETCYFEPMFLVEFNNRLQSLKREERAEEHKVMALLTDIIRREEALVAAAWECLADVDVLLAKCAFGERLDGVMLTITHDAGEVPLNLMQARHPLLVCDASLEAKGGARPIDLVLRPNDKVLIISGGNAGGKTVCLKTLGLIVLMTLTALPVPVARGSSMPPLTSVYALIGDAQSLEEHVSTFTGQIAHLASLFEAVTAQTLVILDEFGAGTDPAQGAALAQAVLDELREQGATVVTATHFPALKTYALSREGVRAASMLFDPQTKQPLFALAYDQVGASQALEVAREYGMPAAVLERASQYLLLDGEDMSVLMERLNALAVEREKDLQALKVEQEQCEAKRAGLQERFDRDRQRLHGEVQSLMQAITQDMKAKKVEHKSSLKALAAVRASLAEEKAQTAPAHVPSLETLKVGQSVWHRPWEKYALVDELDARQDRVKLSMNGVFLWVDRNMLALHGGEDAQRIFKKQKTSNTGVLQTRPQESAALRLDLRGKRADVALQELTAFLDRALLSSFSDVEIIHGRGTGALRKQVHTLLATFPSIASYSLAPEDMGGDGMTMVSFE